MSVGVGVFSVGVVLVLLALKNALKEAYRRLLGTTPLILKMEKPVLAMNGKRVTKKRLWMQAKALIRKLQIMKR